MTDIQVSAAELITGITKYMQEIAVATFWTFSLMVKPYNKWYSIVSRGFYH